MLFIGSDDDVSHHGIFFARSFESVSLSFEVACDSLPHLLLHVLSLSTLLWREKIERGIQSVRVVHSG